MQVIIDDRSSYRCDHWTKFAKKVRQHLEAKSLSVSATLYFAVPAGTGYPNLPVDGWLHIFFGNNRREIPGAVEEKEGGQLAQVLVGQMYLRVGDIPQCPDDDDSRNRES